MYHRLILVLSLNALFALTANAQFGPEILLDSFHHGFRFAVGDLDEDGLKDLITSEVRWYRQTEHVKFAEPVALGRGMEGVTLADLDGNGWLDIVAFSTTKGAVWYPNLGGGSFGTEKPLYFLADYVDFGDFDGDGDLDIVYTNSTQPFNVTAHLILNDGSGENFTFTNAFGASYRAITPYDFDGDGDLDVLIATISGGSGWIENIDGAGNFSNAVPFELGLSKKVMAYDMDGDGDEDIVSGGGEGIKWRERIGPTELSPTPISISNLPTTDFHVLNINSDNYPDVLINGSYWRPATPGLPFNPNGDRALNIPGYGGTYQILVTDLNNDGNEDMLLLSDYQLHWLSDIKREATGSQRFYFNASLGSGFPFDIGDIDGDGLIDLAGDDSGSRRWYKQLPGKKLFSENKDLTLRYDITPNANGVKLLDWDSDGDLDFLALSDFPGAAFLYKNEDGMGRFGIGNLLLSGINSTYNVSVKDFDLDGDYDFVTTVSPNSNYLTLWRNDGQDHFQTEDLENTIPYLLPVGTADVGSDGDDDLFGQAYNDTTQQYDLYFIENNAGVFSPPVYFSPIGVNNGNYLTADFNNDGNISFLFFETPFADSPAIVHEFRYDPATHLMQDLGIFATLQGDYNKLLAAEDLDGDGDRDLVFSRAQQNDLLWVENDNGVFAGEQILLAHVSPADRFFWKDMDNDGDRDICFYQNGFYWHPQNLNFGSMPAIVWYDNTPSGFSYENRHIIAPNTNLAHARPFDLDGDGDMDLVAQNHDHLSFLENYDGQGHFASTQELAPLFAPGTNNESLFLYDADNDGDSDVLFRHGEPSLFRNEGGLNFTKIAISLHADLITHADLNGDGYQDIVGYNDALQSLKMNLYQPATGDYSDSLDLTDSLSQIDDLVSIDVDRDGDMDLLTTSDLDYLSNYTKKLYLLLNDGTGIFTAPTLLKENLWLYSKLTVGDIDQDGFDDLIAATKAIAPQLLWLRNSGSPTLLEGGGIVANDGFEHKHFIADMDADGDPDVVSKHNWFENEGNGVFTKRHEVASPYNYQGSFAAKLVGVADLNGDGTPDLIREDGWVAVTPDSAGAQDLSRVVLHKGSQPTPLMTLPFDVDGDGDKDLLAGRGTEILWYENETSGTGVQFGAAKHLLDAPNGYLGSLSALDLDADGIEDLFFIASQSTGWFKALPNGGFLPPVLFQASGYSGLGLVTLADFDGDGDIDLLSGGSVIYENTGNFELTRHDITNFIPNLLEVETGDFDNDGDVDILYRHGDNINKIFMMKYEGSFLFSPPTLIVDYAPTSDMQVLDFDNDGLSDIVASMKGGGSVNFDFEEIVFLKNTGSGDVFDFQVLVQADPGNLFADFHVLDVNNDQLKDIAYQQVGNTQMSWIVQTAPGVFGYPTLPMADPVDFSQLRDISSCDFDDDGDPDLVLNYWEGYYNKQKLAWRENIQNQYHITGLCFFDENENAQLDPNEVPLLDCNTLLSPNAILSFPDDQGYSHYYMNEGSYTLSHVADANLWMLTTSPAVHQINTDALPSPANYLFGLAPTNDIVEMYPNLVSGPTRCNFSVPFWLTAKNTGTRTLSGQVRLVLPPLVEYETATPPPSLVLGDTLVWDFAGLFPSYSYDVNLSLKMPDETQVGQVMVFETFVIVPDGPAGDEIVFEDVYSSEIQCAIDPNDKLVSPNRLDTYDSNYTLFDEPLEYTIRFQNTGNDTAFTITLTDQLDANLDWASFQPLAASHNYEATLDNAGLLKVIFRNILLPDTATNEPASHGYFSYIIRAKQGLGENTSISNTANIFFDFNQPIVTNTTANVMVSVLPITASEEEHGTWVVKLFPNPIGSGSILHLEIPWDEADVRFSDLLGQLLYQQQLGNRNNSLRLPRLASGAYLISVYGQDGAVAHRVLIVE